MRRAAIVVLCSAVLAQMCGVVLFAQDAPNPRASRVSPTDGGGASTTGQYAYDPSGNIIAIKGDTDSDGDIEETSYIYDPMNRVTSSAVDVSTQGLQTQTYSYDVYGNLLSVGTSSTPTSSATNQLIGWTYDAAGNLRQWQPPGASYVRSYSYDALGSMTREKTETSASEDQELYVLHIYTASDERYGSIHGQPTSSTAPSQYSLRDLDSRVLREFSNSSSAWSNRDTTYRGSQLLASYSSVNGRTDHYSLDHLGTPRVVSDQGGKKLAEHAYYPFGTEITNGSVADGPLRFTGHERDVDIGGEGPGQLDYMHARYYAGRSGRFLSVDPTLDIKTTLRNPQMWNRYSYVVNNPLRYTDPDGRYGNDGLTLPMTPENLAMDENTPGIIKGAFYAEGALLTAAAGSALWDLGASAVEAYRTWRAVRAGQTIATTATTAYKTAEEGGKHAGYLENMATRPLNHIANAIRGYGNVIQQHISWLKDPTLKVADWAQKTSAQQQIIRQKWLDDIARNKQLQDVMQGLYNALTK